MPFASRSVKSGAVLPTGSSCAAGLSAFGFASAYADWSELVARDDLDLVSVTGPNFVHRDVAVAAAQAGRHLWVEKPAGRDAAETREIATAARAAGKQAAVGFNYRNVPAVERARQLVADGRLGRVEHVDIRLLAEAGYEPVASTLVDAFPHTPHVEVVTRFDRRR